jgi:peptide-methionine (S)-S-oxide reductase
MKKFSQHCIVILLVLLSSSCSGNKATRVDSPVKGQNLEGFEKAYFASGCFWCVEAIFESVKGVKEAVSGYAGGKEANPTYRQVSNGSTGHTEAVEVYYNPEEVSFETLLIVFYGSHNPVTVNGQYPDFGTQYRSAIFYQNEEEKLQVESFIKKLNESGEYDSPIATEVAPLTKFWKAEGYHQDYEKNNPYQPYVLNVSVPRLKKFQGKYPELLKKVSH